MDDRGRVQPILANVMLALRQAPDIAGTFAYDEMLCAPLLNRALPTTDSADTLELGPYPHPVRDEDVSQLQEWLQHQSDCFPQLSGQPVATEKPPSPSPTGTNRRRVHRAFAAQ
jgi:hypothetical protein